MNPQVCSNLEIRPRRPDSFTEFPVSERFQGLKSKVCFESISGSPCGISARGNALLGVAIVSDCSPHFKLLDHVKVHGLSCQFEEAFSLMEILRASWFVIPLISYTEERCMISDIFPSLSVCLGNNSSRVFIKWADDKLQGNLALLVIGWGNMVFLWSVGVHGCTPLVGLEACESDNSIDDVRISLCNESRVVVSIKTLAGPETDWSLQIIRSLTQITVGTFEVEKVHPEILRITQPNPVLLSSVTSKNGIDTFLALRTRKGIQIHKQPTDLAPSTTDDCLRMLLTTAVRFADTSLLDIARRLADLHKPIEWKMGASMIDPNDPLASVLGRFTQSTETILMDALGAVDDADKARLAFGLHHIHCQIDGLAKSGKKLRLKERGELLALINKRKDGDQSECSTCGLVGNIELVGFKLYNICHQGGHRIPLCMKSLETIDIHSPGNVSECCWCFSIYKTNTGKSCGVCEICRIGLVTPI